MNLSELVFAIMRAPAALVRRSDERRHRKLMQRATRYSLADFPENTFGKAVGRVRPHGKRLLEAPLSGRLCVYYEVSVDAMNAESLVRTLATEQEGIAFELDDGTSRALVDPVNAFMSTGIDFISRSTLWDPAPRERALLVRHEQAGRLVTFSNGLRYREAILEADETIAVFGGGVREPDPEAEHASYRATSATRLCLSGSARFPLFISDDPKSL